MMRRWYQTVDIEGAVFEDVNRKYSKFWNEGKWYTFIEPLLPQYHRGTFIEIGCNAGLFLKMARNKGFKRVIGVEGNNRIFPQALKYRESVNGDYELVNQMVGLDLDLHALPIADVVLMSNVHYYFPVGVFSRLVDELRTRTLYCIIVSARAKRRSGNALYDLKSVAGYFRDWDMNAPIMDVDTDGDPCPRPDMFSICFNGGLTPINIDEYYGEWWEASKVPGHKSRELAPAMYDFFVRVIDDEMVFLEDTLFYDYWRKREPKRSHEWVCNWLRYKAQLAKDIRDNGMKYPIYLDRNHKMLDGIHRLCIAKILDYGHILARVL